MRNDLTPEFKLAMTSDFRSPIQLLVFNFPQAGKIYVSDRNINVNGYNYIALVESWGNIGDSANQEFDSSDTVQSSIVLINKTNNPFSDYFLYDNPENVKVDYYQWFQDIPETDIALIDTFVIQDPIEFEQRNILLTLDLVSMNMFYDGPVGRVLSDEDFLKAMPSDIGKGIDLIIGQPGQVPTLCTVSGLSCTLKGLILKESLTISVNEDIIELGFPVSGYIQIDNEIIRYVSRDINNFYVGNVLNRGYNDTEPEEHSHNSTAVEYLSTEFIIGDKPLESIDNVLVDGRAPDSDYWYNVFPNTTPPKIVFESVPSYVEYSSSDSNHELIPNSTIASANTAQSPELSYDDTQSTAAIVHNGNLDPSIGKTLSISHAETKNLAIGEIVSAYIEVTHWAGFFYKYDDVNVTFDGKYVGVLSKPNENDSLNYQQFWDITHDHKHISNIDHTHIQNQAYYAADAGSHNHEFSGDNTTSLVSGINPSASSFKSPEYVPTSSSWQNLGYLYFNQPVPAGFVASDCYLVSFSVKGAGNGVSWGIGLGTGRVDASSSTSTTLIINDSTPDSKIVVYGGPSGAYNTQVYIYEGTATWYYSKNVSIGDRDVDVAVIKTVNARNDAWEPSGYHNDPDTVYEEPFNDEYDGYTDINIDLTNLSPSKTITDKFDLMDNTNEVLLPYFFNKPINIEYSGALENDFIFITDVKIVIQYRKAERSFSYNVSCKPTALESNRPDKIVQMLLEDVGMDESQMGSVHVEFPEWDDSALWLDSGQNDYWNFNSSWSDGGQTADVPNTPFDLAAQKYNALGYMLDGVISATDKVKDVIKNIMFQVHSKLIWNAGKAKLTVLQLPNEWLTSDKILSDDIQLKSISSKRQDLSDVFNHINCKFDKDYILDLYDHMKTKVNKESILLLGNKEITWDFDLVRDENTMEKVSNFYIEKKAKPSTFYELVTYLSKFDLEKTDIIEARAAITGMRSFRKFQVNGIERVIGSAKTNQINLVKLLCESYNWVQLLQRFPDDIIELTDSGVIIMDDLDMFDSIRLSDLMYSIITAALSDDLDIDDDFSNIVKYWKIFNNDLDILEKLTVSYLLNIDGDSVQFYDNVKFWDDNGFAQGGFGMHGFGGHIPLADTILDVFSIVDNGPTVTIN